MSARADKARAALQRRLAVMSDEGLALGMTLLNVLPTSDDDGHTTDAGKLLDAMGEEWYRRHGEDATAALYAETDMGL